MSARKLKAESPWATIDRIKYEHEAVERVIARRPGWVLIEPINATYRARFVAFGVEYLARGRNAQELRDDIDRRERLFELQEEP